MVEVISQLKFGKKKWFRLPSLELIEVLDGGKSECWPNQAEWIQFNHTKQLNKRSNHLQHDQLSAIGRAQTNISR